MRSVSISLITVTFNAANTLENCIISVIKQAYPNLEHIVIDAQSADTTPAIINKYKQHISHFISEPDKGIYDAMNKGIKLATGDIIGILNADDCFAADGVLAEIALAFVSSGADIIYGDVDYINKQGKITRKWRAGVYKQGDFNWGWMPPHPSFYVKRELFNTAGLYNISYGTAADYELMLRYMHVYKLKPYYLNKVVVNMLIGGASNNNINGRIAAWKNDFIAMRNNNLYLPWFAIVLKPLRKIIQYL